MPQLVIEGRTLANQSRLDHGITDLMVHQTAQGPVLYAMSGPNGGLTAYALGGGGGLGMIDFAHFPSGLANAVLSGLTLLDGPGGQHLVFAGDGSGTLTAHAIGATGMIDGRVTLSGISAPNGAVLSLDQMNGTTLFLSDQGAASIRAYAMNGALQLTPQFAVNPAQAVYAGSVFAMETVTFGSTAYLVGAGLTNRGVSAYMVTPQGLVTTGNLGAVEGIGIMTPTALVTTVVGGRHFVLLASAPSDGVGQSGAISVMELRPNGSLVPSDHVIDTQATRFGMIQTLEVVTSNGVSYVLAGGGDDGLALFVLLPNGRLVLVDQMVDGFTTGLENISAIAAVAQGDGLRVFLASEVSAGVTELSVDTSRNGTAAVALPQGQQRSGSAANDILIGGIGDDSLSGGLGDDILEDGSGQDTMTGGGGRDIFILRADAQTDRITDFEPGRDRLDLSDWPFMYDARQLSVLPTADGAIVTWRTETLVIQTLNGRALSAADIQAAILTAPQRRPLLVEPPPGGDLVLSGTVGPDTLEGGQGNDTINGNGGDDSLSGGSGADLLLGGAGNDSLSGGQGLDTLRGGAGDDLLRGDGLGDQLFGEAGHDTLDGGGGGDRLWGGGGNDLLLGGAGDDVLRGDIGDDDLRGDAGQDWLFGGDGADTLAGGDGDDLLTGQGGADLLLGGAGHDTLYGSLGFDRLEGGDGDDLLFGEGLADVLLGDAGQDTLVGGNGHDRLWGGDGDDRLEGGADDDQLRGENGRDTLEGGDGHDRLWGGSGFDRLDGGAGDDELHGNANGDTFVFTDGHGRDTIQDFDAASPLERIDLSGLTALAGFADYTAFAATGAVRPVAGGVLIDTGGGQSILLAGVALADLDNSDFIF